MDGAAGAPAHRAGGHDLGGHRLAADADEALHAGTAAGGAVRVGEECKIDTLEDFFK